MTAGTTRPTMRLTGVAELPLEMSDVEVGTRAVLVKDATVSAKPDLAELLGALEAVMRACRDGRLVTTSASIEQFEIPVREAK